MNIGLPLGRMTAVPVLFLCALAISAPAQTCNQNGVCLTAPTQNEQYTNANLPVWLRADATTCDGKAVTSFGYSIDPSAFMNWGFSDQYGWHVDNVDFRLASQLAGATYTVHYKAWSSAGECPQDVGITVTGNATQKVQNLQNNSNTTQYVEAAYPGNLELCPQQYQTITATDNDWFWDWDAGTADCTYPENGGGSYPDYTISTPGQTNPSQDQKSRVFYNVWNSGDAYTNPGERYSIDYAQGDTISDHFVYDTYIYIPSNFTPNIETIELDTNWVNSSGNVLILGLQCVHDLDTWQFTLNASPQWNIPSNGQTPVACDPQTWTPSATPDGWNHIQLAGHRDSSGKAYYDFIVVNAHYTKLSGWSGNSTFAESPGWTSGDIILNFQIDGVPTAGQEYTAEVYADGMEMLRGVGLWQ